MDASASEADGVVCFSQLTPKLYYTKKIVKKTYPDLRAATTRVILLFHNPTKFKIQSESQTQPILYFSLPHQPQLYPKAPRLLRRGG